MGRHTATTDSIFAAASKYAKSLVAFGGAVGATATQLAVDGVPTDLNDWISIGIYFLTALGVYQVPNKDKKKDVLQEV